MIYACDCGASGYRFNLSHVILALIALAVTFFVAKAVARIGTKLLKNISLHDYVRTWILRGLTWLTYLIGILVALSILGVDVSTLVLGLGLFTLLLGVAMGTWIENLVAGVMVQAEKEIWVGDTITVLKWQIVEGTVTKLNIRTTVIKTKEGTTVFIPNKLFMDTPIIVKKGLRKASITKNK